MKKLSGLGKMCTVQIPMDCAYAKADLNLRWAQTSDGTFSVVAAQMKEETDISVVSRHIVLYCFLLLLFSFGYISNNCRLLPLSFAGLHKTLECNRMYSKISIARTPMARLPWITRTRFGVPTKFFRQLKKTNI